MTEIITCLSCGYKSIEWPRWSYDICEVCDWEDDIYGNNNPFVKWWANKSSLYENQNKFLHKKKLWNINTYEFDVDKNWRPLSKEDKNNSISKNYFEYVTQEEPTNNYLKM